MYENYMVIAILYLCVCNAQPLPALLASDHHPLWLQLASQRSTLEQGGQKSSRRGLQDTLSLVFCSCVFFSSPFKFMYT